MKKVLALLLCLTMLATLTVAIAAATTADGEETTGVALDNNGAGAVISGETIEVNVEEDTFTYELSIENNPGISSAIFVVTFDNTKISCTKAAAGKVFKAYEDADENEIVGAPQFVSGPQDLSSVGEINLVVASTGEYAYDLDGVIAKLTFKVNEGVQAGDEVAINVAIDYDNTYAYAEDLTTELARDEMTVAAGKVTFVEAAPTTAAPTTAAPTTATPTTATPTTATPTTATPTTAAPTTAAPTTAAPTTAAPTTAAPTTATPTTATPTTEGTPSTGDSMLVYVAIAIVAATAVVAFSMKKREN